MRKADLPYLQRNDREKLPQTISAGKITYQHFPGRHERHFAKCRWVDVWRCHAMNQMMCHLRGRGLALSNAD